METLLNSEGEMIMDASRLKQMAVDYFRDLHTVVGVVEPWPLHNCFPTLEEGDLMGIQAPFTNAEI